MRILHSYIFNFEMRGSNILTALIFIAFITGPAVTLAITRYPAGAQARPDLRDIDVSLLVQSSDRYRKDLVPKFVTNSPFGLSSIAARSYLDYKLFRSVNTESVISGTDGWLFTKKQFADGCETLSNLKQGLNRVEAMRIMAEAADIDLVFSISPDKSIIYPEKLGYFGLGAAACRLRSAQNWRSLARRMSSSIIDHLDAFQPLRRRYLLYYPTDTHFNVLGQALVIRHLAQKLGNLSPPMPGLKGGHQELITHSESGRGDLIKSLQLQYKEYGPSSENVMTKEFLDSIFQAIPGKTVIVHDSFYGIMSDLINKLFISSTMFSVYDLDHKFYDALTNDKPRRILVNAAERAFFRRVRHGSLSWNSQFGSVLRQLNSQSARCELFVVPQNAIQFGGKLIENASSRGKIYFKLDVPHDSDKICIFAKFETNSKTDIQLFLPAGDKDFMYREGYSFIIKGDGSLQKEFLVSLPGRFAGKRIRIDLIQGEGIVRDLVIQIGSLGRGDVDSGL